MRAVIQRVSGATVSSAGKESQTIGHGLVILLGVTDEDERDDIEWLCDKICHMRIFDDSSGVMNDSVIDTGGALLVVSQFTLLASTRKGKRPSYIRAARPEKAIPLYELFIARITATSGLPVRTGWFGARMTVRLDNEGPVTILLDSKQKE